MDYPLHHHYYKGKLWTDPRSMVDDDAYIIKTIKVSAIVCKTFSLSLLSNLRKKKHRTLSICERSSFRNLFIDCSCWFLLMFLMFSLLIGFMGSGAPSWHGYSYALALLLVGVATSIIQQHYSHHYTMTALHMKTAVMSMVYRKVRNSFPVLI